MVCPSSVRLLRAGQSCGFWITPSSVMYVELMILRMLSSSKMTICQADTRSRLTHASIGRRLVSTSGDQSFATEAASVAARRGSRCAQFVGTHKDDRHAAHRGGGDQRRT